MRPVFVADCVILGKLSSIYNSALKLSKAIKVMFLTLFLERIEFY